DEGRNVMHWRTSARFELCFVAVFVCVSAFAATPCAAQSSRPALLRGADFQNWDEFDVSTRVNEIFDITWVGQGRLSSELVNPARFKVGADFNIRVWKYLLITPSYYHFGFRSATDRFGHGNAPILALTPIYEIGRFTISDRNRFIGEIDKTGSDSFWVYGNRPKVDYRIGPARWKTSLFAWDELFWYSKYTGLTKNRVAAGGRKVLSDRLALNFYYQRQDDDRSNPAHINTLGVLVELRIR
ncbi:MAG TPA: DUF2490 domain-containing protein, partial [Blastocatellia bacterium]